MLCEMQGKKTYSEKLFANFQLSERVPVNNFYRRLKGVLDLEFVYLATKQLYGDTGNPSVDPKVFFKLMLVGYLENIPSDRKLVENCAMRLDVLYFLNYDIDEELPWHSTISRTRKLFPEKLYEELFNKVFALCMDSGMVRGATQSIDSALSHANASKESIEDIRQPLISIQQFLQKSKEENAEAPLHPDSPDQYRNGKKKRNETQRSTTDPDARIASRPGKGMQLGYLCNVAVDDQQHVITHIQADFADKRDSECLPAIIEKTQQRLEQHDLKLQEVAADTNYSSGENYQMLEEKGITAWIPVHGCFQPQREGFQYEEQNDIYVCANGKHLTLRKTFTDQRGNPYKIYSSSSKDCKVCPLKLSCIGAKKQYKTIKHTWYHRWYANAYQRQQSAEGKRMKTLRSSRAEPVIGTLMNFLKLRKLRVRGIISVHKVMLLAATVYNLKKYMRQTYSRTKAAVIRMEKAAFNSKHLLTCLEARLRNLFELFWTTNRWSTSF